MPDETGGRAVADQWVSVVFAQGDDYNEVADMGIDEMAAHLAQ
jgi:hypothetical protein